MTDLINAPPPFVNSAGQQVVFVDFTHARYRLEFDAVAAEATTFSVITFKADKRGLAAISMNQPVTSAWLDGHDVTLTSQDSPDAKASFKVLSKPVSPGIHVLTIKSSLTETGPHGFPINWLSDPSRLHCIFGMSDIRTDSGFLEAYLPSNYEFDHFEMSYSVTVKNSPVTHLIFSNGKVSNLAPGHWDVEFPAFFTSSCPWFHLGPAAEYKWLEDKFSSSDGRTVPIFVYTTSSLWAGGLKLENFVESTKTILGELESDFGPFPHDSVTIFATGEGTGGMEYAGATATRFGSLQHELNHSYFARSITPANGDAGWMDEAIASWGDAGYPRKRYLPKRANMGRRSAYLKTTSIDAYTKGRDFLAYLDYVLGTRGGLKPFLKDYAKQKRHQSITAVEFQKLVEKFHGASLQDLFETYIYSQEPAPRAIGEQDTEENPHHLSIKELLGDIIVSKKKVTMAGIHFDESLAAQISIDESNHVRSINHSIGQVQTDAKSPREAVIAYLHQHCSELQIHDEQLTELPQRVSFREPRECKEQFNLLEERHVFDSHMYSFAQTYLNIPVWKSGIKITGKDAPNRIVSAVNTTCGAIKAELPPEEVINSFRQLFPDDPHDSKSGPNCVSEVKNVEAQTQLIHDALGLQYTKGAAGNAQMIRGRFYVYQYSQSERFYENLKSASDSNGQHSPPTLKLPDVPKKIKDGSWYVVAEITFSYSTSEHNHMSWRMLVELETRSVLYLRALVGAISGFVFRLDPISTTGDVTLTSNQDISRLNPYRIRVALNNLNPPVNGVQQLTGKYVELDNVHSPLIPAPTQPSGDNFDYDVRSNDYAAVSAYFHTNQIFEVIESLGFPIETYFKNTRFPIKVDHRGMKGEINAHCVGDGQGGICHACYGIMDNTNMIAPLGRACDPRVHWHELCGHGILYEAVDDPNFDFAHSAGDGISGIFFDPESLAPGRQRFEYVPWHPTLRRRFDRDVASGWAWGGIHDDRSYGSEQILATCHFRVYRAIGGDSPNLGRRKFASRVMMYLILRAIHNLTPATNPKYARDFVDELMAVDRLNWTSEGMVGGAYNKVIRWSFEKQGEYQTPPVTHNDPRFNHVATTGDPPGEDIFINDGRDGEYGYQHIYWNTTTIWNRRQPDGRELHQPPMADGTNYAYVKLKNRGTQTAYGVRVHGFHCRPSAGIRWPTDIQRMTTAVIDVGTVQGNNREEKIVGPFEWTPTANGRGHDCMFMVASSNQDPSNTSSLTGEEIMATWRLVPNDNNVAQRSVQVVPATSPQALITALSGAGFWIQNPSLTDVSMRLKFRLPDVLWTKGWRVGALNHDEKPFDLAPGVQQEIKLSVTVGDDFDPTEIEATNDRDVLLEVLADDGLVGGMTYRLNPTLSDTEEAGVSIDANESKKGLSLGDRWVKSLKIRKMSLDIEFED